MQTDHWLYIKKTSYDLTNPGNTKWYFPGRIPVQDKALSNTLDQAKIIFLP